MAGRARANQVWVAMVLLLAGCGARTLDESADPADVSVDDEGKGEPGPGQAPARPGNPPSRPDLTDGSPLGPCSGGFDPASNPDAPCNCLADGLCYDTKRDACACICPRSGKNNVCVSQDDCSADSRMRVSCLAL